MEVKLLTYTPDPEVMMAAAARVSTSPSSPGQLRAKMTPQAAERLLRQLIASGHLSPLEHANFTFSIEGISRAASHQLVRHRMASYTQQSQRFVNLKEPKYVTPRTIAMNPRFKAKFQELARQTYQFYGEMVDAGVPMEDARFILPGGAETQLVMTMNARELLHASSLRLCDRSQWEIRELFTQVKLAVSAVAPTIGEELKPKCYKSGYCDERESCGLFPTLEELSPTLSQETLAVGQTDADGIRLVENTETSATVEIEIQERRIDEGRH